MRIDDWINQEHLDTATQASYLASFCSIPYSSLTLDNFLMPEKLTALRRVFATEGKFEERFFVRGRFSEEAVPAEIWHAAADEHRASVEYLFSGTHPDHRMGLGTVTNIKFGELLRSAMFMSFLEQVAGIRPATLTGIMTRIVSAGSTYARTTMQGRIGTCVVSSISAPIGSRATAAVSATEARDQTTFRSSRCQTEYCFSHPEPICCTMSNLLSAKLALIGSAGLTRCGSERR